MGESRSVPHRRVYEKTSRIIADPLESCRQELVQWLNSLLQLNITKVEQCGTG